MPRLQNQDTPNGGKSVRHKTLSAYYPSVKRLEDQLLESIPNAELHKPQDPSAYRELLSSTLCAAQTDGGIIGSSLVADPAGGSHAQAIDRILDTISRRVDGGKDVLLFGLRANHAASAELPINTSRPAFENRHVNSPSSILREIEWRILRSRIGESYFHGLFTQASLFTPVGNNCYIQLCGPPVYDLYTERSLAQAASIVKISRKRSRHAEDERRVKRRKTSSLSGESQRDSSAEARGSAQNEPKRAGRLDVVASRSIQRGRMFYGQPQRGRSGRLLHGLPKQHALNQPYSPLGSLPSHKACYALLRAMMPSFRVPQHNADTRCSSLGWSEASSRYARIMGIMREILVRHRQTTYSALLARCRQRLGDGEERGLRPVTKASVFRFVAGVVRGIFTAHALGSEANQSVLLRHIRWFIEMKQHESPNLHQVMQGFRPMDIVWLAPRQEGQRLNRFESNRVQDLCRDLVQWIFCGFLIPLLKNSFYITETAATRYETVYFLHDDWEKATAPHFDILRDTLLEELRPVEAFFARRSPLGVSAVRLVPKSSGFRPIVNLGRKLPSVNLPGLPIFGSSKNLTANQVLRAVHQVLTLEKERHVAEMGNTLFGTNEVFAPIQKLKRELLRMHGQLPRLYFVKMDIKSAFDTIRQDKMLDIVSDILDQNYDYCIMLYALLLPPASKASQGSARRLFKTKAMLNDGEIRVFGEHAAHIAKPLRNAVIVDLMRRKHVTKEACMELLRIHIKQNAWEIGGKVYRQRTGIPQGSKISSLLCSFFYAALEAAHLGFVNQPGTRLLRYIDDFLLITDSHSLARRFVQRMNIGFPEFGAFVAKGKSLVSFEMQDASQLVPVCAGSQGDFFPFCGFMIDMRTLDFGMDYPRALETHVKQTFAVRNSRRLAAGFVGWFSRQLENRNHVAYLDSDHNDVRSVHFNVFVNFALTSMKVVHYLHRAFAGWEQLIPRREARIVYDSLCAAVEYTYNAGRARVKHASRSEKVVGDHYRTSRSEFHFLAITAMAKVLSCKMSRFKYIVELLRQSLASREYRLKRDELRNVVDAGWTAVQDARF